MNAAYGRIAKSTIALLLSLVAAGAGATELRGFRGIAWGDPSERLGPAEKVQVTGDVVCYRRERENLMFGDSTLTEVRFCFNRDRLFLVTLDSDEGQEKLAAEFQSTYGPPSVRRPKLVAWGNRGARSHVEIVATTTRGKSAVMMASGAYEPSRNALRQARGY
jgi:hypothetical protein